jgi:tRNA-specific 2-thiouridylase
MDAGCDVVGVTMKLHGDGSDVPDRPCCSLDSTSDARRVCEKLGIPHYVTNLVDHFGHDVLDDFVNEYARGRTPIPCVRCNTFTKFRDLVAKADAIDATLVATGHYARVIDGRLHRGLDPAKDQSYFLWGLRGEVVARLRLPVGALSKPETRERAAALGLEIVANKPESQDICFVPDGDHVKVIAQRLGPDDPSLQPGPFLLAGGHVVGQHDGFARFTVGQRRGLPGGFGEPMFVVDIEPGSRAVVIGPRQALLGKTVFASELNWLGDPPVSGDCVLAQIRHRSAATPATIVAVSDGRLELAFGEAVSAISPGQSLVLYSGARVIGGGIIDRAPRAPRALPVAAA